MDADEWTPLVACKRGRMLRGCPGTRVMDVQATRRLQPQTWIGRTYTVSVKSEETRAPTGACKEVPPTPPCGYQTPTHCLDPKSSMLRGA